MKTTIKKFLGIALVLVLVLATVTPIGQVQAQAKKKVRLNKTQLTMTTGDWKKLKLKNFTYEIDDIKWTTSNKAVAKVTHKGWVVAYVRGECTITAEIKATGQKFTCDVTVEAVDVKERVIDPTKPIIALSFDDGPAQYTKGLLETLKSYSVTATFFMCNNNCVSDGIVKYADTIREMCNYGCEIGNHTMHHPNLNTCSVSKIKDEIEGNAKKIKDVIGSDKRILVRPPYGNANDTVKSNVNAPLINWSIDTRDWAVSGQSNATEKIMTELKKYAHDGGIILMHDIHKTSVDAVPTVLSWLIQQGYQVCSVSEMFAARGKTLENGKVYSSCISAKEYKAQNNL
ncbi:MAG: polysaccharide deacetylase family protein [Lachnospiraceae bacterium]|nr:polysaccharide deacetylase family protein [Lachnospiraceae bacterium]